MVADIELIFLLPNGVCCGQFPREKGRFKTIERHAIPKRPGLSIRIILQLTRSAFACCVEEHGGAVFQIVGFPGRKVPMIGIPCFGKCDPGVHDLVHETLRDSRFSVYLGPSFGISRGKTQFRAVHRAQIQIRVGGARWRPVKSINIDIL